MHQVVDPEGVVRTALKAFNRRPIPTDDALDGLPAPLYATDRDGLITWYSKSCINFAGRTPVANRDRWCVTWKLFTNDGRPLPHDHCPMAVAIRERRAVRGSTAVAERPDGRRVDFRPFPTPLFDAAGRFMGAVNLLVDITAVGQSAHFLEQARRCRRLLGAVSDSRTIETLQRLAVEYESKAFGLGRAI
jgi:PAS domain-containing protein